MQNHLNNNNRNHYKWSLIILLTIFFTGCNDNTERSTESKAGDLVSVTQLSTHSKQTIITVLGNVATQITPAYSVDNYKVVYKTKDTKGNLINVSGLMALPQKIMAASSPRLSIQHGTIFLDQQAPSFNHQAGSNSVIAASLGFIVTAPDYIGYGESAGQTHPHSHKDTLACAGIDLLRASKSWLE